MYAVTIETITYHNKRINMLKAAFLSELLLLKINQYLLTNQNPDPVIKLQVKLVHHDVVLIIHLYSSVITSASQC